MSEDLRNCWGTPNWFFQEPHSRFDFTVDACALPSNAKLARYWTPEQDGLAQDWRHERVWCNPPYGKGLIQPWVGKALYGGAELAVLLPPVRTDMGRFHDLWQHRSRVTFEWFRGRLRFDPPPGIKASSPSERHFLAVVRP